jgi:hypothetical protein
VRPDAEHSFDCNGAFGVMVFVDPESSEGTWLSTSLRQDITVVPDTRSSATLASWEFPEEPRGGAPIPSRLHEDDHLERVVHPGAGWCNMTAWLSLKRASVRASLFPRASPAG